MLVYPLGLFHNLCCNLDMDLLILPLYASDAATRVVKCN